MAILAITLMTSLFFVSHGHATVAPPPPQPNAANISYTCQVPIEAAESVQVAHAEYYDCLDPHLDEWLQTYPERVEILVAQYDVWMASRDHDLRDRSEAARFVRDHPVDFASRKVSLNQRQIASLAPNISAQPAMVSGAFQRLFVDRRVERLFLTTDEEGLVSLNISQRFAFEVEGKLGRSAGSDFFVIDENTAVIEEENDSKTARDLVVLDISDRTDPQEIQRLSDALPNAQRRHAAGGHIPDRPPTFAEYVAIRQGKFYLRQCGNPPTVSTHPGQRCRPDGSCYRETVRSKPTDEGYCERSTSTVVQPQLVRRGEARRMPSEISPSPLQGRGSTTTGAMLPGAGVTGAEVPAEAEQVALDAVAEETSQGGSGGAGSLSQMMIHDSTLFVLTGEQHLAQGWLTSFDISEPRNPELKHLIAIDNGPEALQRHDNLLLVAGRDALVTASVADEKGPRILGERRQRCFVNFDPVVVEGSIAYRTIIVEDRRSSCRSQLEVIDLSQPHQPVLRNAVAIAKPRGLAVLGDRLFVADENVGVHVYDLTDPVSPERAALWKLSGVKDLVISDFDLYAMTPEGITTYFVGPLYNGSDIDETVDEITAYPTVVRAEQ